jgi:hypothetical protein
MTTQVKAGGKRGSKGTAAMYGMVARIPDRTLVEDFIIRFFGEVYKLAPPSSREEQSAQ